jgi:hypothetical protein
VGCRTPGHARPVGQDRSPGTINAGRTRRAVEFPRAPPLAPAAERAAFALERNG